MSSLVHAGRHETAALKRVCAICGIALFTVAFYGTCLAQSEPVQPGKKEKGTCVSCHTVMTPGIIKQYEKSAMSVAQVSCGDCHEVSGAYPGAVKHHDAYILPSPTTAQCRKCHEEQARQFLNSRHGLPAWVAVTGSKELPKELLDQYQAVAEGQFSPSKARNDIAALEGPALTRFTCEVCHSIGKPSPDQSVGQCWKCHLRHEFGLKQARMPETCNACHIGPDHPQWEIFQESPHGITYATKKENFNWNSKVTPLTPAEFPGPTCAICHMSAFGNAGKTHDVGDRLTWFLFAPQSQRRPEWERNRSQMQAVCLKCHNRTFVDKFYADADAATASVNNFVQQGADIMKPLRDKGLVAAKPFTEPIQFEEFNLWHHWGRTTKFGAWMQGPDYSQWHGAYEMLKSLAELREMARLKEGQGRQ